MTTNLHSLSSTVLPLTDKKSRTGAQGGSTSLYANACELLEAAKPFIGSLESTVVLTSEFVAINTAAKAGEEARWVVYSVEKIYANGLREGQCVTAACCSYPAPKHLFRCSCPAHKDHKSESSSAHRHLNEFQEKIRTDIKFRSTLEVDKARKDKIVKQLKKDGGVWVYQDF